MQINEEIHKPIVSIDDFLLAYEDIVRFDSENILNPHFQLKKNVKHQKITPIVQLAEPKDAKEITEIYKEVYNGTYPYKQMEYVQEIKRMINDSNFQWILYKTNSNKIVGCFLADLDFNNKKGLMHGFVIRKDYQHIFDSLKACIGSLTYLWKKYKNKILIWFGEARTNDSSAQFFGSICGLKPVAFFPNKDVFLNKVESDLMIITYDEKVIKELRSTEEPRIIRQVLNCYAYLNKRYKLGAPIVENPNIELNLLKTKEIKKQIEWNTDVDKYNNQIITFFIDNSSSYFKFLYYPNIQSIENIRYYINNLEELFVFLEKLNVFIARNKIRYAECFLSSYEPKHQKIFHNAGFEPRGYVPCWKYNKERDSFEDNVVFNYYKGAISKNINLTQESVEFLQAINFSSKELIPEFSIHLNT